MKDNKATTSDDFSFASIDLTGKRFHQISTLCGITQLDWDSTIRVMVFSSDVGVTIKSVVIKPGERSRKKPNAMIHSSSIPLTHPDFLTLSGEILKCFISGDHPAIKFSK